MFRSLGGWKSMLLKREADQPTVPYALRQQRISYLIYIGLLIDIPSNTYLFFSICIAVLSILIFLYQD